MKFLHAADIHLDSPLRGLARYQGAPVDEIRGATRRAFENLVELARDEAVDFLLLAGDLYDGDWRDYNTGLFFTGQMRRLAEAGIPVFVIAGNHDAASQITRALRPPDNTTVFPGSRPRTVRLESLGVAIHGQSFASRSVTEDLAAGYPPPVTELFNIGLLHTCLDGRPGHEPYAPCSLEGLRNHGYQYWALGHVHRREVVAEDPWVVFPGNLQGRNARETGPKGASLVQVEEGRVASVEHRALDVVRWHREAVDLGGAADTGEVLDRIGRALERAAAGADGRLLALRLELTGATLLSPRLRADPEWLAGQCRALAEEAGGGGIWVERVKPATRSPGEDACALLERDDAFGGLLRAVRDLELDGARLQALAAEFGDLAQRLPAGLRSGPEGFDPSEPATVAAALDDARDLLLERLLSGGSGQ